MATQKEQLINRFKAEIKECQTEIENKIQVADRYKDIINSISVDIVELEERMNMLEDCIEALID